MCQLTSRQLESSSSAKMIASLPAVTSHKAKNINTHGSFITPLVSVGSSLLTFLVLIL